MHPGTGDVHVTVTSCEGNVLSGRGPRESLFSLLLGTDVHTEEGVRVG